MTARTRWTALLILLGIWAGAALWVFTQSPEPQRAPLTYVSGQKAKREVSRGKSGSGLKIQLALLAANRQRTEKALGSPKNIFAPVFPGQGNFDVAGAITNPVPIIQPTPEELAMQAGRQELAQFRYLGYLSRGGRDEAFLAKGNALHIAKAGETIEQRILVKAISPSGVMLQETSTKAEQLVSPIADMPGGAAPPAAGIMSTPSVPTPSFPGGMMPQPGFPGSIPGPPGNMGGPSLPGAPGNLGGPQPVAPGAPPFSGPGR
jgi:hypothetical protein